MAESKSSAAAAASATKPAASIATVAAATGSSGGSGSDQSLKAIKNLGFDNLTLRALPIDSVSENKVRDPVVGACFSLVEPTPIKQPKLIGVFSDVLQETIGLDVDSELKSAESEFIEYFSGNKLIPGTRPAAACYCGHQFGYFSGQLGDGAAMYLGEVINSKGERWELQFKGAGKTPYSRQADGRKVLRSSLREFLCSEHMHSLGVPTTRAGTIVASSESQVMRDPFYAGEPIMEKCSVITRIAPTFLRFGSFEIVKSRDATTGRSGPSPGRKDITQLMLKHTINTYFPSIAAQFARDDQEIARYTAFFREVVKRTAELVAHWQCVGWCHGVLNTDNMSIVGVTIDYGPYGFMDFYNPAYICNGSDDGGRYSYANQPKMCKWNCEKLAEAIAMCLPRSASDEVMKDFDAYFLAKYNALMQNKLGLIRSAPPAAATSAKAGSGSGSGGGGGGGDSKVERDDTSDHLLAEQLLDTMALTSSDFTTTFRSLSLVTIADQWKTEIDSITGGGGGGGGSGAAAATANGSADDPVLARLLSLTAPLEVLLAQCRPRFPPQQLKMVMHIAQTNPEYLEQLGVSPELLMGEMARVKKTEKLQKMSGAEKSAADRTHWVKWLASYRAAVRALAPVKPAATAAPSEQKAWVETIRKMDAERVRVMHSANPKFILRNYLAQHAIERAEDGDYTEVQLLMKLLRDPYNTNGVASALKIPHTADTLASGSSDDSKSTKVKVPKKLFSLGADVEAAASAPVSCHAKFSSHTVIDYAGVPPDWALGLRVTCSS